MIDPARIRALNGKPAASGPVLYWMSRDQRIEWNWALQLAVEEARRSRVPLVVVFTLAPAFLGAAVRQYDFMLRGLRELEAALAERTIGFTLLRGEPSATVVRFARECGAGLVVSDFSPLRITRMWKEAAAAALEIPLLEVDAHNIVPSWSVSHKQEYAARTIRPKIHRQLTGFLQPIPPLVTMEAAPPPLPPTLWDGLPSWLAADPAVPPVELVPGEAAAQRELEAFIAHRLASYAERRNDPNAGATSNLSAYLHFGQISAQQVAMRVMQSSAPEASKQAFIEELVVRRELSDNYCLHNPDYDRYEGLPAWARDTLAAHAADPRAYCYSFGEFEGAATHEALWNAAQRELLRTGKIHGYLRMYWAKKILEWSRSPEEAFDTALRLNDRWALDGRDPNGYVGVAWSIGGLHDRPWFERPVFGKIRYMNASGCARKFDVKAYIARQQAQRPNWAPLKSCSADR